MNQVGGDMKGYIKLDRKILNWGWFKEENMLKLWLYLLLTAQHQDTYIKGVMLKRGEVLFGRKQASKDTGISEQSIRTCINRLKSTNEITTKSTNKYTIITILKYDEYQNNNKKSTTKSTKKLTNNQPTTNQQLTTYKNVNNDKNVNKYIRDIYIRVQKLIDLGMNKEAEMVSRYIEKYEPDYETYMKIEDAVFDANIRNKDAYVERIMKG